MSQAELDETAVENFREYLRIPSVHPDINYGKRSRGNEIPGSMGFSENVSMRREPWGIEKEKERDDGRERSVTRV